MVEYKASLRLKIPKQENVMGLAMENYNVVSCDYQLKRGVNKHGEVCTSLKGGIITLEVTDLPTDGLMEWVFNHQKKYNGEITIFDVELETLEQLYFEKARCVDFTLHYKIGRLPYTLTKLTLVAEKIQVGEVHFENISK